MEIWHWILWGLAIIGLFVLKRAVKYFIMPGPYWLSEYQLDKEGPKAHQEQKMSWRKDMESKLQNNSIHEMPSHSWYHAPEVDEDDLEWEEEMKRKYNI